MAEMVLKRLMPEHTQQVAQAEKICFSEPWSLEEVKNELSSNALARYWGLFDGDVLCAYAGVWMILDEGHITNVAVLPPYRRCGYGRMLMQHMIDWCCKTGCKALTLEVRVSNTAARALYEQLGFVQEGIRKRYYLDNGEDALILWLRLHEEHE